MGLFRLKRFVVVYFTSVLLFSAITGYAQSSRFPNGIYLSHDELKTRKPSHKLLLNVSKQNQKANLWDNNDYKLEPASGAIKNKLVKKKVFAYVDNDKIYLNGAQQKLGNGYISCISSGNFLIFTSCNTCKRIPENKVKVLERTEKSNTRYLYVLNLNNGSINYLTRQYMYDLLKNTPSLLKQYKEEKNQDVHVIMVKYLDKYSYSNMLSIN